jgi:glycosyltransferase involved in cell wall biosynthesis
MSKSKIRVVKVGCGNLLILRFLAMFRTYQYFIAIDPHGFVLCKSIYKKSHPIYYSLELYMSYDYRGLNYSYYTQKVERDNIKNISGLIIQSKEKEELFCSDYNILNYIPKFILPVTYQGPSSADKSDFIRIKFVIKKEQRIALHLGGIAEWFSCIELAIAFSNIPSWALVFHGFPSVDYLQKFKKTLKLNKIKNVYIHDEQYDDLARVDEIVRSCDLGVAWYNDISIGFRTAGHSSGKIPAYMRFGLPVVAKKYRSTLEAIETRGAGICVDSFDEIAGAVAHIEANYEEYSQQARKEYDTTYNFEVYKEKLTKFLATTGAIS